ncbi:methylated-DNA--[protein]-cysteine S-methyltransferase, partial [uncultured Actinomyces sp.]|uniref:methylated-DNA--[protein]-cysteine S-methyltransferase n=1 Tax=uncultured Actinomyces sp. TaxID=249061 RepID=UPI0028EF0D2B
MPSTTPAGDADLTLGRYDSPAGRLTLAARGGALVGLWVAGQRFFGRPFGVDEAMAASAESASSLDGCGRDAGVGRDEDAAALAAAASWLDDYFAWRVPSPARAPLSPMGSEFQLRVWEAMSAIPYGHTMTYGQLAYRLREAGIPASARAVGGAVARNPLLLIRPCHRVVASTGPGGYA